MLYAQYYTFAPAGSVKAEGFGDGEWQTMPSGACRYHPGSIDA
jgi:hypothetical protein